MYGQLVSDIRNYVEKAKFMGLENAESTRLLEIAAGVIEFETAVFERLCHPELIRKEEGELMNREDWARDLARVDEIAIETGKFQQQDYRAEDLSGLVIHSIYWLSVAVWHLLEDKIKGAKP